MNIIQIKMQQGINRRGNTITQVCEEYPFRKYKILPIKIEEMISIIANFTVKYKLPNRRMLESEYVYRKRIEDLLADHLEIWNINA